MDGKHETAVSLSSITKLEWSVKSLNPFSRVNRCRLFRSSAGAVTFDFPFNMPGGVSGSTAKQLLDADIQRAVEVAKIGSPSAASTPAATATAPTPPAAPAAAAPKLTKRVQEGRKLREQLLEINRLRHQGSATEASELASSLESAAPADAKKLDGLARQRVRELRDTAFSFGKLELTREIVRRFVDMPEVRPLLTTEVIERRRDALDGETARDLIKAAKAFFGELLKAPRGEGKKRGGRRTDNDRNAHAAALAALLPRDLFENKRGRAAMRLLGLTYRQAKRGTELRGEMEDRGGGWKRQKTSEHFDKVSLKIVDEFWHSELASDPDNQNKQKVGVYLGVDSNGDALYDLHPRRAQTGNLNVLLGKFRKSEFGARFRAETATKKRPQGAKLGRAQLVQARCPCIKKRSATQCDCQLCTYVIENLARWHKARSGWRSAKRQKCLDGDEGPVCDCHIHRWLAPSSAEEEEEAAVWHAAGAAACEPDAAHTERWAAATTAAETVRRKRSRALKYDGMTASPDALLDALQPCGKQSYPNYSVTGASVFRCYSRACAEGNCPKKLFDRSNACDWENVFGDDCPLESSNEKYDWWVWSKQLRGTDKEGKPFYSLEWMPHRGGTRAEHLKELRAKVREWKWHVWRDRFVTQSLRVFDDRRSGARVLALRQHVSGPLLLSAALDTIAEHSAQSERELRAVGPQRPQAIAILRARTFAILARLADADAASHRPSAETVERLRRAEKVHSVLANTTHVKSDYASQVETKRSHTATCATMERHNLEVTVVGFAPYQQARSKAARKRRPQKREVDRAALTRTDRNVSVLLAPPASTAPASTAPVSAPARPPEVRFVHKQHVYIFYAFHGAGFKPNARSHNVVQEDIDHFLKYGYFLHGEWFEGGERCPGGPAGQARKPLPPGLTEAPHRPPVLPNYNRRLENTDGCPNQYDYGDNHRQTAEWLTKTASWPEARAAAERWAAAEAAAMALAAALTDPTARAAAEAAAAAAARSKERAQEGITRVHVKKVEMHGKDVCDGASVLIAHAIIAAITSGALLDPGTRELVLYLADLLRAPATPKELKDGWEAPTKYFFGFVDTAKFTKSRVPSAEARGWDCNKKHFYIGRCADAQRAQSGPLETASMFCACDPCLLFDFGNCQMAAQRGDISSVRVPLKRGEVARTNQIESLEAWAKLLKPGMVVAVRAAAHEVDLEGPYWLLLVDSEPFEMPEDMAHSTDEFEEGWLVVRGRFYSLVQRSPRGYQLTKASRLFLVNTMIRYPNIIFAGGSVGKAPRESRSGVHVLEDDMHNLLNGSV